MIKGEGGEMIMRNIAITILLLSSMAVMAGEPLPHSTLHLKDGSYLHISDDNTMTMVDKAGNPIKMKDGVEMELKDGSLIMMKNRKIWRHFYHKSPK
jgi:Copper resistance protein K